MKTCLITGADSGIGKAAAYALAKEGYRLLMPVRNLNRGERVIFEIMDRTANKHLILLQCDLASLDSIKNCVNKLKDKNLKLDILINNAGAYFSKYHATVDGLEATFQINYLSRFYLVDLLLQHNLIKEEGRIINVNGDHHKGKLVHPTIMEKEEYKGIKATSQSKLADMLFTYELSRRLTANNISVNAVNPGAVKTNIIYSDPDLTLPAQIIYRIASFFMKEPETGAEGIVYLAVSDEVKYITGKYFKGKKRVKSSEDSYNIALARKLWEFSEKLIDKKINQYNNSII